ncbi:MAG: class I SAM-dependent methyltransferase [Chloroflexota bacterium]
MTQENFNWDDYYKKIQGRAPRQLLLDVLEKFQSQTALQAIDLGSGDGTETAVLLSRGWHVLAVDGEFAGIKRLMDKVPQGAQVHLQTQVAKFEEVKLPPADLIHASYSIPFCHPDHFPALWEKISTALNPGGRFAGQFFGVRDSWADNKDMTFHTEEQVRAMLNGFETEHFHEQDEDGQAASGPKHWHVFTVIARRM